MSPALTPLPDIVSRVADLFRIEGGIARPLTSESEGAVRATLEASPDIETRAQALADLLRFAQILEEDFGGVEAAARLRRLLDEAAQPIRDRNSATTIEDELARRNAMREAYGALLSPAGSELSLDQSKAVPLRDLAALAHRSIKG